MLKPFHETRISKRELRMEFCPNCGCRLEPKKQQTNTEVSIEFVCPKCSFTKREAEKQITRGTGRVIKHDLKQLVTVIGAEDQKVNTMPTIRMECPKCGNMLVYIWQVQTRGGDEASTQFMRCTKCSHTFREYT